jgi:starch synthase
MRIALLAAECAPVAKAGGLGDFVHGLGRALMAAGADVEVVLPDYDCLRLELVHDRQLIRDDLRFEFAGQTIRCRVFAGQVDGLRCRFLAPATSDNFFARGRIYGEADDALRFACYCRAALEFFQQSGAWPDILHCNDWQTGLVPVLLYEDYAQRGVERTRVCYSLHNLGHQGWVEPELLSTLGLNAERLMTPDRLQGDHLQGGAGAPSANLMKGGIVFANFVTTVSPRYAWEVLRTEQGEGLQAVLAWKQQQGRFAGVLNGIDQATWNPRIDPLIAHPFDLEHPERKSANTQALRERLGLGQENKPLIAVVSRLDRQKGVGLIAHAMAYTLARQGQFVLLGSALDAEIQAKFERLRAEHADDPDCHLELGYDETLAHQIYAGADLILVPSLYEPCGLTQMIAMRYGCVPIVRRVGGLADTVFDATFCTRSEQERNGFVFDGTGPDDLEFALERAIGLWFDYPQRFQELRLNGMRTQHPWDAPAEEYLRIYARLVEDFGQDLI